ncbi:hypothetical protein FOL47_002403 [Perkinsus chesapeaki]|uniref:Uncharacterized protein n=1 Tax=Perkinsus chesapeaki TaxID=330153 RepID=A0A7J6KPP7_PERCH|nr:hypothetical protein FOL47_002403 [Perkinsus chesapeaki]
MLLQVDCATQRRGGPKAKGCAKKKKSLGIAFWRARGLYGPTVNPTEIEIAERLTPPAACELLKRWRMLVTNGVRRQAPYGLYVRRSERKSVDHIVNELEHRHKDWWKQHGRMCLSSKEGLREVPMENEGLRQLSTDEVRAWNETREIREV